MFWNSLQLVSSALRQRLGAGLLLQKNVRMVPQIAGVPAMIQENNNPAQEEEEGSWIWFAVPKRKHTKSRKRMKTTAQKRIPLKKNIVFDPRTGEVTLKHKLPFNWKDYLPKVD